MRRSLLARISLASVAIFVVFTFASSAFGAATIVIQNNDAPNVGFNDPTPVAPVGGNPGTTLGQQRLNAFQFAANIWGAMLTSNTTITVRADWQALSCTSDSAVLGTAGSVGVFRDFPGAPFTGTLYGAALSNALRGSDASANPEISASFNVNLGNADCFDGVHFYLGLDNNHGGDTDLVAVLLHEFSHGLGFQTFTNASTGQQNGGFPSIFDRFLFDNTTGKTWVQMTNAERQASAISVNKLAWSGPRVTADVHSVLASPSVRINSPAGIAGNYSVGTADFGAPLSFPGVTANVTQALPIDGCSALTNSAAISGKIALIDRGNCFFIEKVKIAQNAGAVGVIIVNTTTAGVVQMGGSDNTITIPSVSVADTDGNLIKAQLGAPVNATLLANTAFPSGTDSSGRALLFAPTPLEPGSSVSHWDTSLYPNQLMEPFIGDDLTHSVVPVWDLTLSLFQDIGWHGNKIFDSQFFVRQHYLDFLGRSPDSSGLGFWNNEIVSCALDQACIEVKRINVSAAFYLSIEFQETGYLAYRTYKTAFADPDGQAVINSQPTVIKVPRVRFNEFLSDTQQLGAGVQVGIGNWQQQLENNKQAYMLAFVQRGDFQTAFPASMSADAFVTQLDARAGGVLSAGEKASLIAILGATPNDLAKRAQVLRAVAEDDDLKTLEKNRAFVLMQYFGYLRRNPNDAPDNDHTGWKFWLDKLNAFNGNFVNAEMVKAFISSIEYQQRF